jgi:DNA-binding response OmpR family regulator
MDPSSQNDSRVTILIAGADDHYRQPFSDLSQSGQLPTFRAKCVDQALKPSHRERIDIAPVDGAVPTTNGLTVCQTLKGNPATCLVPILVLTSCGSAHGHPTKQEGMGSGRNTKP